MGTWCVSTFWLLWIKVLWTFMYKFLCGHTSSFLLGMYLGGELLDHMINLCLTIWGTSRQFSPVVSPLCVLTSNVSGSQFQQGPTSSPTFVIIWLKFFFFLAARLGFWDLSPQPGIKRGARQWKLGIPVARPPGNSLLSHFLMTTGASGCELVIWLWLWFAFPWWLTMLSIFSCA